MRDRGPLEGLWGMIAPVVIVFSLAARVAIVVALLGQLGGDRVPEGYVARFTEIAAEEGRPYRDHPVEYPPVSLAAIELIGDPDARATGVRLLWLALACDAVLALTLHRGWGRSASLAYLGASVFVLPALYQTLDVVPAVLATLAVALAQGSRERWAGVLLAAATLAKLWPVVVVPGWHVESRRRALAWCLGSLVAGMVLWTAWAGWGALGQVATQRESPGWEAESTVGALVWILGDDEVRIIKDSPRVGVAPTWAKMILAGATAVGVAWIWSRAARRGAGTAMGAASLACVALLLVLAPIYSYPYVLWLLPWAAIAWSEGRAAMAALSLGVVVLTTVLYAMLTGGVMREAPGLAQSVLVLRNALTGAIPVAYLLSSGRIGMRAAGAYPGGRPPPG